MNKPKYANNSNADGQAKGAVPSQEKDDQSVRTLCALIDEFEKFELSTAVLKFNKDGSTELNYRALLRQVRQLASGLRKNGLEKGTRAIIAAPNSADWIIACLAIIYSAGTVVPVDLHLDDESLKHIVLDSDVHWIFTDAEGAAKIRQLCPRRHFKMLILGDNEDERSWTRLLSENEVVAEIQIQPEDPAILFYTSGTTGMPKGVPLTHSNIIMQLDSVIADLEFLGPEDRLLLPLPLFHVYPLNIGLFSCLKRGLPAILPESLTGPELMRAMNEGKATMLIAVPRLLRSLYSGIESKTHSNKIVGAVFDFALKSCELVERYSGLCPGKLLFYPLRKKFSPNLKTLTSGGALLEKELAQKLRALGWDLSVGYGLTETSPLIAIRLPGNHDLESVGAPIPGVEIRITPHIDEAHDDPASEEQSASRDKKGASQSPNKSKNCFADKASKSEKKAIKQDKESASNDKEGEIEVKGPNVFHGYLNLDDKSEEAFTEDGWFKTGDLGFLKNGNLHISGRASSLLVMEGGKKIQPDDIEDKFAKNPVIREIAILQFEHKLVALVVPNRASEGGDAAKTIASALNAVSSGLASHLKVNDFAITRQPLPRTNLGKLKRHELIDLYKDAKTSGKSKIREKATPQSIEEMDSEDRQILADPAASQVWEWLSQRFPDKGLSMDTSPQLDLNIDSFEWMNLSLDILQNTGVELNDEAIARIETIRDLLNEVNLASNSGEKKKGSPIENPDKFIDDDQRYWLSPLNDFEMFCKRILYAVNWALMHLLFRVTPLGLEEVPEGQVVFIPNHASYLDILVICAALPFDRLCQTQIAGWTGIAFANPFNCFMSRLVRAFPIDAKKSLVSSLALGAAVLKSGSSMIWFPEGERTLDGKLLKFKPGIGILLQGIEATVVPIYLDGTREALPPGAFFPKFSFIHVIFGKAFQSSDLLEKADEESVAQSIAEQLRQKVKALGKRATKLKSIDKSE